MSLNDVKTRRVRISTRKVAMMGADYESTWIGTRVLCTTWDGERLIGTITHWRYGYPVVTFDDGRWRRCDQWLDVIA